jgi:ABC-type multidrug transport system ATPase subunit
MEPVPSALKIEKLQVNYGKNTVLRDLDLTVGLGEIFGLLGPNGSGKTTLVRSICGRLKPESGSIRISGQANGTRRALRQIGLVPQEIALYQHLTARENLIAFGRLSGLSRQETGRALSFAVDATKLAAHIDDFVHTLSGGWKRRVNIAAAILHHPTLLILDEPMVGVDIDARYAVQAVIRDLSQFGLAVLLVTHDLDEAETLCTRVGFLRQGRLDPVGRPADLLKQVFNGYHEVLLELREPAPGPEHRALLDLGFAELADGLEWRGLIVGSVKEQAELANAFDRSNLSVKEVRYRVPGLDSLFISLTNDRPTH